MNVEAKYVRSKEPMTADIQEEIKFIFSLIEEPVTL
jgi:hypothetical protein